MWTVIPDLVQHAEDRPIRVWVPSCSTGEEAYSLAMLFLEEFAASKRAVKLQIFASDIGADALDFARNGVYPDSIKADVSAARLQRFFCTPRSRLSGQPRAARLHRIHRSRAARRPAVFASRFDLLPQPADLSAAGGTAEGFVAVSLRAERGQLSVFSALRKRSAS
jgi:chemotaxis methyl-accepting protein methylase